MKQSRPQRGLPPTARWPGAPLTFALAAWMLTCACAPTPTPPAATGTPSPAGAPARGGSLIVGLNSQLGTLDPNRLSSAWETNVAHQIYDYLVAVDSKE